MASLLEIRNQITATKGTKKITKAMQLVAASKMKTFQNMAVAVRGYTYELLESLQLTGLSLNETSFAEERSEGKTLFVLLTSDKGLCGAMNARLIRQTFNGSLWNEIPENERLLITVGRKSTEAAKGLGIPIESSFQGLNDKLDIVDAMEVIGTIVDLWNTREVKRVVLIAPEYVNAFVFNVQERQYLPLNNKEVKGLVEARKTLQEQSEDVQEAAFFEPDQSVVAEGIGQQVAESLFVEAFYELKATEYSSRMAAMKKATEAADDKIKELTNAFNRARQTAITRQLSELASANEAMSSENMYESFEV